MDVYGFDLSPEQYTVGSVTLFDEGDGAATSLSEVQIGWEVSNISASHALSIYIMAYVVFFFYIIVLGFTKDVWRFTHPFRGSVDGE
jgi:hypothetical protein